MAPTFCLLHGLEASLAEGICGILKFSKVSAFCQIRESLGRFLSGSVDSHLAPTQNNRCDRVEYFRVAYSFFFKNKHLFGCAGSYLRHAGFLVMPCELFVVVCGI